MKMKIDHSTRICILVALLIFGILLDIEMYRHRKPPIRVRREWFVAGRVAIEEGSLATRLDRLQVLADHNLQELELAYFKCFAYPWLVIWYAIGVVGFFSTWFILRKRRKICGGC